MDIPRLQQEMRNNYEVPAAKIYSSWRPVSAPGNQHFSRSVINIDAFVPKSLKYVNDYPIVDQDDFISALLKSKLQTVE
ncbi:MAG: hypothetical protein WCR46_22275 [Deltaproteobacteria bacterium]